MQEKNMTALMSDALKNYPDTAKKTSKKMKALSKKNEKDLSDKVKPDYFRIPTAEDLIEFRQYAIDYKKLNKQASKREVRRAVQSHFNIKIYR